MAVLIGRGLVQVLYLVRYLAYILYSVFRVRTLLHKSHPFGWDFLSLKNTIYFCRILHEKYSEKQWIFITICDRIESEKILFEEAVS